MRTPHAAIRSQSGRNFPATHWSLVLAARGGGAAAARAIEELCRGYWFPIYADMRRRGLSQHDAEDVTQGFFADLLSADTFDRAEPDRGRLRTFLLAGLQRFLVEQYRREHRAKRGGGVPVLSLELTGAEERYAAEPIDLRDPEKLYLAAWARSLVEHARARLRETYGARAALYQALEPFLDRKDAGASYREVAAKLGIPEVTARVHVSRLRKRFGEFLKDEVRQTVESESEVESELAWVRGALGAE